MSTTSYKLSAVYTNDNIFLLVGDTVYSINRRVLLYDSEFFKELFELPPETGCPIEGSSAEHPLGTEGISQVDFELWLRVMFPLVVDDLNSVTVDQWMVVLKLLTMWRFTESTKNVLERLRKSADPITKILLSQQYELDMEVWLVPSVRSLVQRVESLSEDEGARLGGANTAKIARIREGYSCCCKAPPVESPAPVARVVGFGQYDWPPPAIDKKRKCCTREEHDFTPQIKSIFAASGGSQRSAGRKRRMAKS